MTSGLPVSVVRLNSAMVAALAAARVSPAAPKAGRTPDGVRTDSGALAGRESPKSDSRPARAPESVRPPTFNLTA